MGPTFIIADDRAPSNRGALAPLWAAVKGAPVHLLVAHGATRFSQIAPVTELLARRIRADGGTPGPFTLSQADLDVAMAQERLRLHPQ